MGQRPQTDAPGGKRHYVAGLLLALMGAIGQAIGYVISDIGMDRMDPTGIKPVEVSFMATQIRVLAATLCFVVLVTSWRRWPQVAASLRRGRAMAWIAARGHTRRGAFGQSAMGVLKRSWPLFIRDGHALSKLQFGPLLRNLRSFVGRNRQAQHFQSLFLVRLRHYGVD